MNDDAWAYGDKESEPVSFEGVPTYILIRELELTASHQAILVAQLQFRYGGGGSLQAIKDEEIASLKAQLEVARAEVASVNESARKLADEKISLLARVGQERAELATHRVNCVWVLKYLQRGREKFFLLTWRIFARLFLPSWR